MSSGHLAGTVSMRSRVMGKGHRSQDTVIEVIGNGQSKRSIRLTEASAFPRASAVCDVPAFPNLDVATAGKKIQNESNVENI